ncbi:hypothetical protein TNCV_3275821 [Trichonephila clavipes]|nr:hypothetical protein TNCV_3275821 [Trichonephila clavipes]
MTSSRDPLNLDESISAALIEEQNMKLNQIANDERSGLSPAQTENSVLSALTDRLEEINLRVGRLQTCSDSFVFISEWDIGFSFLANAPLVKAP